MSAPRDVTKIMVDEHKLILRMIALVEDRVAKVEAGTFADWDFFLDAVDFIRSYADRFHHGKEEAVLFVELAANGMPEKNSPIEAMMTTHHEGRVFVRALEEAALKAKAGEGAAVAEVVKNARAYAALLRNHIAIEDGVLYPLAERVLPAHRRDPMADAYARQEEENKGIYEKYLALVERHEAQG